MDKNYSYNEKEISDISKLPDDLYGNKLTDIDKHNLINNQRTGLKKDFIMPDGETVSNVKLQLVEDKGKYTFSIEEEQENLEIPEKIGNHKLSQIQQEMLMNNEILGPLKDREGREFFYGVDQDLNKVTVRTSHQMGLKDRVGEYELSGVDKYQLANGKATDTHIFKTKNGDYFSAKIALHADKKGMEFLNVKPISKENAQGLIDKLNVDKTITDKRFLLNPVSVEKDNTYNNPNRIIDGTYPVLSERMRIEPNDLPKGVRISTANGDLIKSEKALSTIYDKNKNIDERHLAAKNNKQVKTFKKEAVKYESLRGSNTSFTIQANKVFVPKSFKGVSLSSKQRNTLEQGLKSSGKGVIDIKGVNHFGKKLDGTLTINSSDNTLTFTGKSTGISLNKGKSLEKKISNDVSL